MLFRAGSVLVWRRGNGKIDSMPQPAVKVHTCRWGTSKRSICNSVCNKSAMWASFMQQAIAVAEQPCCWPHTEAVQLQACF